MLEPEVLALPLEEALHRCQELGWECQVEGLLPPRDSEAAFEGKAVRKYVVRQRKLTDNRLILTFVYRLDKEV